MIRAAYWKQDGQLHTDLTPEAFSSALEDAGGQLWVDIVGEPVDMCEPILLQTFGFHPLAVDDALQEAHVPKVDDWEQYLYVVMHAPCVAKGDGFELDGLELDIFLGQNYCVTYHDKPIEAVDRVWALYLRDERHHHKGPDHILYRLADEVAASFMPVMEGMDEALDEMEDQLFARPAPATVERLFALKRSLLHMRRIIAPQRETLNKLARDEYAVIDGADRIFFRDVYDHYVRLHDLNESLRDLVGGALDTYLSVINNRMNEIMKTLTTITTLFMPISFLAGVFGMNFFVGLAPGGILVGRTTALLALVLMLLIPVGMFLWMRKRAWM